LLPETQISTPEEGPAPSDPQSAGAAVAILNKAIAQMETEDGWVGLRALGQRLANIASDFDPRTYGFRKLSDLVRQSGAFEINETEGQPMRLKAKPADAPVASPRTRAPRRRRSAS